MGPSYGKLPILFPYHFHIFQDSYGSGMGIVWEAYHKGVPLLGVPGITLEFVVDLFKSTPRTKLGGPPKFEVVTRHIDRFMGMFGGTPPNHIGTSNEMKELAEIHVFWIFLEANDEQNQLCKTFPSKATRKYS